MRKIKVKSMQLRDKTGQRKVEIKIGNWLYYCYRL